MIAAPAGDLTEMVGKYVTEQTGMRLQPGMYQAMMVVNDNKDFVAGVVFTNYRDIDIEVSCASETPAAWRPTVCRAIFKYIFDQLGCVRCTSTTAKGNRKARSFLESLGFQLEGNVRLGYDGRRDAMVYGLLRSECRFLSDEGGKDLDGKEQSPAARGPRSVRGGRSADQREYDGGPDTSEPEPDRSGHAAG